MPIEQTIEEVVELNSNAARIVAAPVPDFNSSIYINSYQNTRENGDMLRMLQIKPTNVNPPGAGEVRTFIINNEYLIDTRKSYVTIVVNRASANGNAAAADTSDTILGKLIQRTVTQFPGGSCNTSIFSTYSYFEMNRHKEQMNNPASKSFVGNQNAAMIPANQVYTIPLYAFNTLFSNDYYYSLLLNGVTAFNIYFQPNFDTTTLTSCELTLATVGNNKMYDYLRGTLMAGRSLFTKIYQCDCQQFTIPNNNAGNIVLGYYHPSVVAVVLSLATRTNQGFTTPMNISIGSSAKIFYTSNSQQLNDQFYLSNCEMPYSDVFTTKKFIVFPLYNVDPSDWTGVNCENVTMKIDYPAGNNAKIINICVIYNAVLEYKPNQNLVISDNLKSIV